MSSPPPSDRPKSSVPQEDVYEPVRDQEDTGPLHASTPSQAFDSDWDASPAQGTWAGRFDAPLTVSPRPVRSARNPNVLLRAVGAVVAVARIGGNDW